VTASTAARRREALTDTDVSLALRYAGGAGVSIDVTDPLTVQMVNLFTGRQAGTGCR
jgi:hypothetical protein